MNEKYADNTIQPVLLESVGRVIVSESYKIVPEESAFYRVSRWYDEKKETFVCNGVVALRWNSQTSLFEINDILSQKYQKLECVSGVKK